MQRLSDRRSLPVEGRFIALPDRFPHEGGDPDRFARPVIKDLDPRLRGEGGGLRGMKLVERCQNRPSKGRAAIGGVF
jgi:hypothetical protein